MVPRLAVFIILCVFLSGCETDSGPAAGGYEPPVGLDTAATIKGSMIKKDGFFDSDHLARIVMINSQLVRGPDDTVTGATALIPGKCHVVANYRHASQVSQASLVFHAEPRGNYQVMIKQGVEEPDKAYCEFWIADATTGEAVTDVVRRHIASDAARMTFSVPQ